jgi:hypothetical protein
MSRSRSRESSAEPRNRPCGLDQACLQTAIRSVELCNRRAARGRCVEARAHGVATELVESKPLAALLVS